MYLSVITPPGEEPVSVQDVQAHTRDEVQDDTAVIAGFITAARQVCEHLTDSTFVNTTYNLALNRFPWAYCTSYYRGVLDVYRLPRGPIVSVTGITYLDNSAVLNTLDPSRYLVTPGSTGGLSPAYGTTFPSGRVQPGAVNIQYVAGYGGAADVPQGIKTAVMMLAAHYLRNRESVSEAQLYEVPQGIDALLSAFRWGRSA